MRLPLSDLSSAVVFELIDVESVDTLGTLVSLEPSMLQLIALHAIDTSDWFDSSSFESVTSSDTDVVAVTLGRLTILIGPKINSNISLHTVMLGSTMNSIKPRKYNLNTNRYL